MEENPIEKNKLRDHIELCPEDIIFSLCYSHYEQKKGKQREELKIPIVKEMKRK